MTVQLDLFPDIDAFFRKSNSGRPALTQARLKQLLIYDPDTGVFTRCVAVSNVHADSTTNYHTNGYIRISVDNRRYGAHQLAWLFMTGVLPNNIDHINRIRDDNRWCNLREVTYMENSHNASVRTDNTSGHPGVTWSQAQNKWWVSIKHEKQKLHLGFFSSKEDAIAARKKAESIYHPTKPI